MKYMTAREIREAFIRYFESKNHTHVASSSLVPYNDNTLLFVNAGMVQFKDVFLGVDKRDYSRAVTAQRCVRAGGKHNDLDTVGRTARHHTFFEMMGNFSFGDYFKREAITYCWEFLTEVLEMPKDRLYATVYEEDDEAFELWQEISGMTPDRIFRIGAKDNFWSMGDTGPCGPCSEVFFDRGEKYGCDAEECAIGKCDCDRWMEIWNLVFMQYDRDANGTLTPLPRPSIDTGMGLERVTSIMQEVDSNYDTDIMRSLIKGVEDLSGQEYHGDHRGFPFRVIADHARSCSFMIADGILPSNEGRGYVLRRILRRAARFGLVLGLDEPFLYKLFPLVKASLADAYPILLEQEDHVVRSIRQEEERFHVTLRSGMGIAQNIVERVKEKGESQISGSDLFLLYDTYGFPLDLSKDIAEENGLTADEEGFAACMAAQREKSKSAKKEGSAEDELLTLSQLMAEIPAADFCGYTEFEAETAILAMGVDGQLTNTAAAGTSGWLALQNTPFYAESGGQAGDTGCICGKHGKAVVLDTQKLHNGLFVHKFEVQEGVLNVNDIVTAAIDEARRRNISRNHSATHLLHKGLRTVLGDSVHQAGSQVTADRLRFDFNYSQPMTAEELREVEDLVNDAILRNMPIKTEEMPLEQAKATGAMAFFGDKYGDVVRLVTMGDYSLELCGGAHCQHTGDIGCIKILGEFGIGSGMRRIEAVTGNGAIAYFRSQEDRLQNVAALLKVIPDNIERRLEQILNEYKAVCKENEKLQAKLDGANVSELWQNAVTMGDIPVLAARVPADDVPALRKVMDLLKEKLPEGVLILAAAQGEKTAIVVSASQKAQDKGVHAGKLIKEVATVCGGSGGGRADMAQAGGKNADPAVIDAALEKGVETVRAILA